MKKLNQKGFGVVEGLLAVIAITLLVGVGFYVVNSNKKDDEKKPTSNSQAQSSVPENQYVELKEFGVKFKKTDKLKDVTYDVDPQDKNVLFAHSPSLNKLIDDCRVKTGEETSSDPSDKTFSTIVKGDGKFPGNYEARLIKQFDTFYLLEVHPMGAYCGDESLNENISNKLNDLYDTLSNALKSVEKL